MYYCHRISASHPRAVRFAATLSPVIVILGMAASCVPAFNSSNPDDSRSTLGGGITATDPSIDILNTAGALSFTAGPTFCCDPLNIQFDAVLGPGIPLAGVTFLWTFGDDRSAVGPHVEHTYPWPGQYEVRLTAVLPLGPTLTTSSVLTLSIDGAGTSVVVTPSPPTGGGSNDPNFAGGGFYADAGPDQTVTIGDPVMLDGSNSRGAPSPPMRFTWIQASGPPVTLSATDEAVVRFTAPMVTESQPLTFVLIVTQGALEDADQVRITVDPFLTPAGPSTRPVVFSQSLSVSGLTSAMLTLQGADPDGDNLTFSIVNGPSHGTLGPIDNSPIDSAVVTYFPTSGYQGPDSFTFVASDGVLTSTAGTVTLAVHAQGRPPEARNGEWLGQRNRAIMVPLIGTDEDGDSLTFTLVGSPVGGTVGPILPDTPQSARIRFTPNPDFEGTATIRFRVSDAQFTSSPATVTIRVHKAILPWREINLPAQPALELYTPAQGAAPGMTVLDFGVAGLNEWSNVANEAIITTIIPNIPFVYPQLMNRRPPGMRLIGGFKTVNIPGTAPYNPNLYDFTNAAAWQEIAQAAQQVVAITGTNIVVLENETTLTPYYQNLETIDYAAMHAALAPLRNTGIEFWWWLPVVLHDWNGFPDRFEQTTAFTGALAQALPNSVFLTGYSGWYSWEQNVDGVDRQRMIDTVGLARIQEGLYVSHDGYWHYTNEPSLRCFTAAESFSPTGPLSGDTVRIYPPGSDWIQVSQAFNALLPPLGNIVGN